MRVLSFGHIPSWAGGHQESGLANVIYQLALHMSNKNDVIVLLAATDVNAPCLQQGDLVIAGWTTKELIHYALIHPFLTFKFFIYLLWKKIQYKQYVKVIGMLFKGLFLHKSICSFHPDIVHLHAAHSIVYLPLIRSNCNIVLTHHGIIGFDSQIKGSNIYAKIERDTCKSTRFAKLYFIASGLVDNFKIKYNGIVSPTEVILNAYDSKVFNYIAPKPHSQLTLITVASFSDNKGQKRVMEAIANSDIQCNYICVGASDNSTELEYRCFAEDKKINYYYYGRKRPADIREILSKADYMILPSSTEGFGLVFLESIACGVPVILPKHLPIVQEKGLIQPGVNAILLEDSSVEAISNILPKLLQYHFDHKIVADSILNNTWDNVANQYINSFKKIMR